VSAKLPPPIPAAAAPMQPGKLGKYTLTAVLGEGAMGTVYKGIDPVIHRPVAVKVIRRHLFDASASRLSAAQRFRNEAQAAGRLSHPGIVGVYEYGEDNGDPFIAMEYVEGTSLSRFMSMPERMPEPDIISVMVQLLDALHYAHEQGVWHRDIKPNNIIITPDGRVKIADFGIARIESTAPTQVQTTMLIGSPGYIAPERYTGETKPDRRVDIFSCGALLYHMLTGISPFAGTDSEVMYKVLQHDPTPPSHTNATPTPPRCYDAIVAKALAKRPDDRYASAKDFRDAMVSVAVFPVSPTLSRAVLYSVIAHAEAQPAASSSPSAPAPAPAPVAVPPSKPTVERVLTSPTMPVGWDPTTLAEIGSALARHVGPVAKVLVRRTARECTDVPTLVNRLAEEALSGEDRKTFVARTAKLVAAARSAAALAPARPGAGTHPPTAMLPVLTVTPLKPETIAKAQTVLTAHIGPIAKVMVKRASAIATQREQFFSVLADLAGEGVDRDKLLAELSKLA
jgi:eukaryotic-like serine/threonine-protein kinase